MGLESVAAVSSRAPERVPLCVSVVITTYNRAKLLPRAIDSALQQDFSGDMEVIVVDDGSTDGTQQLIQSKYGDRVRYHYKPNGGMNSATQRGIELSRGDVIALLDSDDYWYPNKLSRCVPLFEQAENVVAVLHDLDRVDSSSGEKYGVVHGSGHADFDAIPRDALFHYQSGKPLHAITSGLLLRRRAALETLPFPEGLLGFQDLYFVRNVIFYGKICAIHSPLSAYAVHDSNDYGLKPVWELSDARLAEMNTTGRVMSETFNSRCRQLGIAPSPRRERIQKLALAEGLLEQQRRAGVIKAMAWLAKNELRIGRRERLQLFTHLILPARVAAFLNNRILSGA